MELSADKPQMEQILLNLMKNSIESLCETTTEKKMIQLKALFNDNGRAVLQVSDNGKGIPPDILIPDLRPVFYNKKERYGNRIKSFQTDRAFASWNHVGIFCTLS